MGVWTVNIGGATAFSVVKVWVEEGLNTVGTWEVGIAGVDSAFRAVAVANAAVLIYRDSTLLVSGVAYHVESIQGGGLIIKGFNKELDLVEVKCPIDAGTHKKLYSSTTANAIFADLIGGVTSWSSDVSGSTATSISMFRTSDSMSVWQGVMQLLRLCNKDVYFDRSTLTAYLTDKRGTASAFHFNEGTDMSDISYTQSKPKAAKVVVFGKSDGTNQITGSSGSGTPVVEVIDRNIINTTEANNRAASELALIQSAIKQYSFMVYDVLVSVSPGDQGFITAPSCGLSAEAVDIVMMTRGLDQKGVEFLKLEVTNGTYRVALGTREQMVLANSKNALLSDTSMQGSTNHLEFPGMINGNSTYGLNIPFYIGSLYQNETGDLQINSMTLDYDIDPFRKEVGTATEDLIAPGLTGGNTASHKHDATDSGHDHALPTMTSASYTGYAEIGSFATSISTSAGSWDYVNTVDCGGTYDFLFAFVKLQFDSWSGTDTVGIQIRYHSTGASGKKIIDYGIHIDTTDGDPVYENTYVIPIFMSSTNDLWFYIKSDAGQDYIYNVTVYGGQVTHTHSITGYNANSDNAAVSDSNKTPALTGTADSHDHNVAIGDAVSESGSVNATSVTAKVQKWNTGTSVWDTYATYVTGDLLGYNLDLGVGVYPNSTGWWRVNIITNNTTPDLIQGVVKIKHHLDS